MPSCERSVSPSMRRAGNLLLTTRTFQPGVLGAVPSRPTANSSGGVRLSRPSQKGHFSMSFSVISSCLKSVGLAARSVAIITQRRLIGSFRSSGTYALTSTRIPVSASGLRSPTRRSGGPGAVPSQCPLVQVEIPARRPVPGEVRAHPLLLHAPPDRRRPVGLQRAAQRAPERLRRVRLEHEPVRRAPLQRLRSHVDDGIRESAGAADDRYGTVAQAVELVQPRGL